MFRAVFLSIAILLGGIPAFAPALHADTVHVVRKGETIYAISRHYGLPPAALMSANHLASSSRLRVGQRLSIPGVKHPAPVTPPHPIHAAAPVSATVPAPPPSAPAPADEGEPAPHYLFIVGKVKQQIDSAAVQKGRWRYIVFHHSGTPNGNAKIFDYYHRNVRGMENGLAYHFVIGNGNGSGDGEIEVGGRWLKQLQGGHLHSDALNMIAIGVCFVGNFDVTRPSKKQIAAAIELTTYLRQMCGPPDLIFKAHREINPRPTECPGKLFPVAAFHKLFDN